MALVTGATGGIGGAIVRALVDRRVEVMATGRREQVLQRLAAETGASVAVADLASEDGCESAIAQTLSRFGRIDILVNNAGLGSADEVPITESTPAAWRSSLALNLDAPFHLTRLAGRDMVARGWGRIVMVSSTAGELGAPAMPAYCAAKHGVLGLMRATAVDLARFGVTCNAVLPGWVRTEMAERSAARDAERLGIEVDEIWDERVSEYPAGRLVTPDEVAGAVAWLCSEEASGTSGQSVTVALGGLW